MRSWPFYVTIALVLIACAGCGSSGSGSTVKTSAGPSRAAARANARARAKQERVGPPPSPAPPMTVAARLSPAKAGTAARPQPVVLDMRIAVGRQPDVDPPPISSIDVMFPAGTRYDGGGFPVCSAAVLGRQGPAGCPAGSVMGSGRAVALADTTTTVARLTIVNGGPRRVLFYTAMDSPARVRSATAGTVAKLSGGGAYRMHLVIPQDLQSVAGVPLYLRSLEVRAGRGDWLATTGCPRGGRFVVRAVARFVDGSRRARGAWVGCG